MSDGEVRLLGDMYIMISLIGTFQIPVDSFQKTSGGDRRVIL
jgi:hypothetical protein